MNDQNLEDTLDHGIEESFPASDPVSIVCIPANEERFAAQMKAAMESQTPPVQTGRLVATALATGAVLMTGVVGLLQMQARQTAATRRRASYTRAAFAMAGALAGSGLLLAARRALT